MGQVLAVLLRGLLLLTIVATLAGCERTPSKTDAATEGKQPAGPTRTFQVKGIVISVKPREKTVEIKHEAIPDYMPGMTMPFDVRDTNLLTGLVPGEAVEFRLVTTDTDAWIDQIRMLQPNASSGGARIAANGPPTNGLFHVAKDVQPIQIGEPLPEYHLTNQFGQPFSTRQFQGQALAITFLFTRCPFPTFCPRMANNFEEVQEALLARKNGLTNWHLLTVSFDPDFDKPEVLKAYAQAHGYQPEHWTFATGSPLEITALGDQVGLTFWHDETGSISHNLRTVVVNATGKARQIFVGNQWSSAELADEMVKAAKEP